jgi:hypothetical protein
LGYYSSLLGYLKADPFRFFVPVKLKDLLLKYLCTENTKEMDKVDKISRKWWSYLILIVMFFFPSYSQEIINPEQIPSLVKEVLMDPLIFKFHFVFPFLKVLSILIVMGLLIFRSRFRIVFMGYFLLLFTFIAIFQNMSNTQSFGFSFITGNMLLQLLVVSLLVYELIKPKSTFVSPKFTSLSVLLIMMGLLAFWFPVDSSMVVSPRITYFFNNNAVALFCMMWPFFLSVNYLFYPMVNPIIFRIGGFIGILYGIINVAGVFNPQMIWVALFHLPLLIISLVCFMQSFRMKPVGHE